MRTPDRPPIRRLIVTFGATYQRGSLEPADGEIAAVKWWTTRPPALQYDALDRLPI
jgi:hypothetical protein